MYIHRKTMATICVCMLTTANVVARVAKVVLENQTQIEP